MNPHDPPERFLVVVPVRNGEVDLPGLFDCIATQVEPPSEVVVVDDGSDDGTPRLLTDLAAPFTVVRLPVQQGVAAARNAGTRAATRPWDRVVFVDADDRPAPEWLQLFGTAPRSAVVSRIGARLMSPSQEIVLMPALGLQGCFLAGTFAIRKAEWILLDGFDEALSYSENTDVSLRLRRFINDPDDEHLVLSPGLTVQLDESAERRHARHMLGKRHAAVYLQRKHGSRLSFPERQALARIALRIDLERQSPRALVTGLALVIVVLRRKWHGRPKDGSARQ